MFKTNATKSARPPSPLRKGGPGGPEPEQEVRTLVKELIYMLFVITGYTWVKILLVRELILIDITNYGTGQMSG